MAGIVIPLNSVYGHHSRGWEAGYDDVREAVTGDWGQGGYIAGLQAHSGAIYLMRRGMADFDMSDISESLSIVSAKLVGYCVWELTSGTASIVIVDATGVTAGDSGYGEMLYKTTSLGSKSIPVTGGTPDADYDKIEFNAAGLSFLESKAGGLARIGLRIDNEIAGTEPGNGVGERFGVNPYHPNPGENPPYILINYLPTVGGYIWVEETKLAYTDSPLDKRTKEGTKSGATGATLGYIWVEGNNLRYIDASGDERYIAGSSGAASGKTAGIMWIEGTEFHYIDSSGNERCFEGTAA